MEQEQPWYFIEPWCRHLRGHLTLETRGERDSMRNHFAWLRVTLPPDGKGTNWKRIQELREAVELLDAVARVDHQAFRELLVRACGLTALRAPSVVLASVSDATAAATYDGSAESSSNHSIIGTDCSSEVPGVAFTFNFVQYESLDISWGATLYRQFFLSLDHAELGSAFHDAMTRIRAIEQQQQPSYRSRASGGESHAASTSRRIPIELAFAPSTLPVHWSAPYLQSVLEVVQAICDESDCSTSAGGEPFPFALRAVTLDCDRVVLSDATLPLVRELVALGVHVPSIVLDRTSALAASPHASIGQFIAAITSCASTLVTSGSTDRDILMDADEPMLDALLPASRPLQRNALHLVGPCADAWHMHAFCSALASAQSIASVRLSHVVSDTRDDATARFAAWQWLAFAFFRPSHGGANSSSVCSLRIDDMSLRDTDVQAVASIVRATHPARALVCVQRRSRNDANVVDLTVDDDDMSTTNGDSRVVAQNDYCVVSALLSKGTRIFLDEDVDDSFASLTLDADDHFLVLRRGDDDDDRNDLTSTRVDVLVPGYGRCTVVRDDIQGFVCDDYGSATPSRCEPATGITALHLAFTHAVAGSTLEAFVALIGAPLERLVLETRGVARTTLTAILAVCRRLTQLSIDMVNDGALLSLLYAYDECACRITSLSLRGLELDSDEVTAFVQVLGASDSALARTLQELSIGARLESYALDEANLCALLAMLQTNARLEALELYVEHALYDNFAPLFHEFHDQPLAVCEQPLSLACRLAFLSVLVASSELHDDIRCDAMSTRASVNVDTCDSLDERAHKRPRCDSLSWSPLQYSSPTLAMPSTAAADTARLDRHVVALIFAFAATPKRRIVRLVEFH